MLSHTLIKYCRLFLQDIDRNKISIFLESSPQYPNLLSVMHTLRYIGLEAYAGQCDWDYLKNLNSPFLLHIKIGSRETIVISKWDNEAGCLKVLNPKTDKWEPKDKNDTDIVWDGVIIYTDARPVNTFFSKEKLIIFASAVLILSILYLAINKLDISIALISPVILGLVAGLCAYWQNHISKINIIDKICHSSSLTDCNAIETSTYSSLGGFNMSCMAVSFFLSQIICVALSFVLGISDVLYTIYFVAAVIVVPISIYSVYSQIKIGKACPLCLLILICVIAQTVIFGYMSPQPVNLGLLTALAINQAGLICLCHLHSQNRKSRNEHLKSTIQLLKLKRNKNVLLLESSNIEQIETSLWLGSEKSPIKITTIISPGCNHCRKVVSELLSLMDNGVEFRWNIILGKMIEEDSDKIKIWVEQYISDRNKFVHYLHLWSEQKILNLSHTSNFIPQNNKILEICQNFSRQTERLNILGFPQIVLNDRLLSTLYTINDLEFILTDLSH